MKLGRELAIWLSDRDNNNGAKALRQHLDSQGATQKPVWLRRSEGEGKREENKIRVVTGARKGK